MFMGMNKTSFTFNSTKGRAL